MGRVDAMGDNQRVAYLDYARVIVALLVIVGHLVTYDCRGNGRMYIYAFHMPFFFMVSGMLHKYRGAIEWRKYARTLLLPAAVFIGAYIAISSVLFYLDFWDYAAVYHRPLPSGVIGIGMDQVYVTLKGIARGTQIANIPCWFLLALFWCKVMTDVLEKYKRYLYLLIGGGILLFILMYKFNVLYLKQALMAFPIYYIGYKYKNAIDGWLNVKFPFLVMIVLFAIFILSARFNGRTSMSLVRFGAHKLYSIPLFYLNGFVASMAVLYFSSLFKERQLVVNVANSLVTILCVQMLFCYTVKFTIGWADELTLLSFVYTLAIAFVILILCYLIHQILYKHLPWIYGKW